MSDFEVMLAKVYDPEKIKDWNQTFMEPKLDGVRIIITIDDKEKVLYRSRNGRELDMFKHLDEAVLCAGRLIRDSHAHKEPNFHSGVMFDGEMIDRTFGEIAGAIHRKEYVAKTASFWCFHVMPLNCFSAGVDSEIQMVRRRMLQKIRGEHYMKIHAAKFSIVMPEQVFDDKSVKAQYARYRRDRYEGAIVKDYTKPWIASRSHAWMKIKEELSLDLPIVSMKEGTGKYKGTLGALIVKHGDVEVPVSGMDDALRDEFWKNKTKYKGKIAEIIYQEETVHGSLRHPRFKRLREDKS